MSWDVTLIDPVTQEELCVDTPHFMRGGTYCIDGTRTLELNVTYNYSSIFRQENVFGKSLREALDGKQAADTIPIIEKAIENLNSDVNDDYWEATEGNVKRCLYQLLALAKMRPDGVWEVV